MGKNVIKYSTGSTENTIRKGNFHLGVNNIGYGPTETTGFWNTIEPPLSGYTIYGNKNDNLGPSIYVVNNDSELIDLVIRMGASNISTISDALSWINSNNEMLVVNKDYENIVTDGLVLNLDAGFSASYPKGGNTWTDLSGSDNNGTLINEPTFSPENDGSLLFNGINEYINLGNSLNMELGDMTIFVFIKIISTKSYSAWIVSKAIAAGAAYRFGLGLLANTNQVRIYFCGNPIVDIVPVTTSSLSIDTWYSVCGVWNRAGDLQVFINGIEQSLVGSKTISSYSNNNFNSTYPYRVGAYTTSNGIDIFNPINAEIPLVLHYNRALTSEEILQNYNATKYRFGL